MSTRTRFPKSSRLVAPTLDGTEAWLCPWGTDMTTFAEVEVRWGVPKELQEAIMYLRFLEYEDYLRSNHWQAIRLEVHRRQDGKCQFCNGCIRDVHHCGKEAYGRKGFERDEDVVGLCGNCHSIEHNATAARIREEARNLRQ